MTVAASSYDSHQSAAIVELLSASATFQAINSAASAAAALDFIIEDDGGPTVDGTAAPKAVSGNDLDIESLCWATVRLGATRRPQRAQGTFGHEGEAAILLVVQADDSDSAADAFRRARNAGGSIAAEMQALVGSTAARPAYLTAAVGEIVRADETSALGGAYLVPLAIAWRDIP